MHTILLVEDDRLMRRLYTKKLTKSGFNLVVAEDGSQGMVRAQNEPPDLILLDLMMPKASGFDMLEALSASPQLQAIPVVVLTNVSSEQDEQKARKLGAIDYLVKANNPPDKVVDRVNELLAQHHQNER